MIKMKKQFLILFLLSVMTLSLFSQSTLTIEINGLRNNIGQVLLDFNNEKGVNLIGISKNIDDRKCIIIINNIKPGNYTFKYFHDENQNNKLDLYSIGFPNEGYGFSNNANGAFSPPSLKEMRFEIKGDTTIRCTPKYINIK